MEIVGSEDKCAEFLKALAMCQGQVQGAVKNQDNPFFSSRYSDLASVWAACRQPLSDNGLSVVFMPQGAAIKTLDHKETVTKDVRGKKQSHERQASVTTLTLLIMVSHSSGAYMVQSFNCDLPFAADLQKVGAAIRYLCRYSLSAIVGIPQVDDDAESLRNDVQDESARPPPKVITAVQVRILEDLVEQSGARLEQWLEYFRVDALENLPVVQFKSAVERLNQKIQANLKDKDESDAGNTAMASNEVGEDHGDARENGDQQPPETGGEPEPRVAAGH